MNRSLSILAGLLMAVLIAGSVCGCARARERWRARFNPPEPEPARLLTAEGAGEADRGLEIAVWTADDTGFRVGRVMADLAVPAAEGTGHDAWAAMGLRVLAMPAERVDELLVRAPPVAAVQRQRYAQLPIWTPLVRGPRLPPGVAGPGGRALPVGRPRLIARAWTEPDLSGGTADEVLRTELTIQIESAARASFSPDLDRPTILSDGPVLDTLLTALVSDGSTAFVIVAESPSIVWDDLPAPGPLPTPGARSDPDAPPGPNPSEDSPPAEPADEAAANQLPSEPFTGPGGGPVGPFASGERTLGERMLASPGIRSVDGRPAVGPRKVIMVLIPQLPEGGVIVPPVVTPDTQREDPL